LIIGGLTAARKVMTAMNQQCPKCGTTYAITPSHVGRTFTCKNCSSSVVVTSAGLTVAAVASPPPPPPTGRPFDFESTRKGAMALGDYDDEAHFPARHQSGRYDSGSGLGDFLAFRKMIIPIIIQIIFWLLVSLVSIAGVAAGIMTLTGRGEQKILGVLLIVVGIPLSILLIRLYCELIIVIFRINDTLTDIKNILARRRD
jgi:Domain of unknown function (DUF4282)